MDGEIKTLLVALVGAMGWIGLLARGYFSSLAAIKLEEAKNRQQNAQRLIENQEKYFEILLKNILVSVKELRQSNELMHEQLRSCLLPTIQQNNQVKKEQN